METKTLTVFIVVAIILMLVIAFVFKPMKRGLEYYFVAGIVMLVVIFVVPYFHAHWGVGKKAIVSLLISIGLAGVWMGGFVIAGYKIINRLF